MLFTALELSARILVTVLPALDIGARFKLTRKGPRGFPSFPDHDLNGFRNPENHDTVCIAALGDSQVYGTDVSYEFAWPFQLEKLLALPVLNAAIPGWGTIHQYMALDEVMAKKPKLVISLFYTGNDLLDNLDGEALLDPTKPLPPKDWKFRLTFPRIKNYLVSHL